MPLFDPFDQLLKPAEHQAIVLVIRLDSPICADLTGLLTEQEQASCRVYHRRDDRISAGVSRGLWRLGAGVLSGVHPRRVVIERNQFGRPSFLGMDRAHTDINVSRTRSNCAMVLSRGARCGIDIERVDSEIMSDDLIRFISAHSEEYRKNIEDPEFFFAHWTHTEAVLKADGRGLSDGFEIVKPTSSPSDECREWFIGPKKWTSMAIQTPSGVVGAIAFDDERQRVSQVSEIELEAIWSPRILCASGD